MARRMNADFPVPPEIPMPPSPEKVMATVNNGVASAIDGVANIMDQPIRFLRDVAGNIRRLP